MVATWDEELTTEERGKKVGIHRQCRHLSNTIIENLIAMF
jgi:hypothetical protein